MPNFLLSWRSSSVLRIVSARSSPSARVIQPRSTPIGSDDSWNPTAAVLQMESEVLSFASIAGRPTSFQKYLKQPFWISSSNDSSASDKLYFHADWLSAEGSIVV